MLKKVDASSLFAGMFGVLVGSFVYYTALQLNHSEAYGYYFFPQVVSAIMFISGLFLLFKAFVHGDKVADSEASASTWADYLRVVGLIVLAIIYLLVLDTIGFLFATIPFLCLALLLFGVKKILPLALVSVITPSLLYFVFNNLLNVYLP